LFFTISSLVWISSWISSHEPSCNFHIVTNHLTMSRNLRQILIFQIKNA
jgi:hypothetical protein